MQMAVILYSFGKAEAIEVVDFVLDDPRGQTFQLKNELTTLSIVRLDLDKVFCLKI